MLNLGSDWLLHFMPHALRKVSRVHFGLLLPDEMRQMKSIGCLPRTRRYLAVPFVGKDAPSQSAEFAHPDVAIGLTILAYRYEGLRIVDFGPALMQLRQDMEGEVGPELKRPASLTYISWLRSAGRKVRGTLAAQAEGPPQGSPSVAGGNKSDSFTVVKSFTAPPPSAVDESLPLEMAVGGESDIFQFDLLPLHLLDFNDIEYMTMLFELLKKRAEVVQYYLEYLVFPDTTAHQAMKLSANGQARHSSFPSPSLASPPCPLPPPSLTASHLPPPLTLKPLLCVTLPHLPHLSPLTPLSLFHGRARFGRTGCGRRDSIRPSHRFLWHPLLPPPP